MLPVLILATLISFTIMQLAPGGPEEMLLSSDKQDSSINLEKMDALREKWGLNDPVYIQYLRWLGNVARGDLGDSYVQTGRTVKEIIGDALPNTLELSFITLLLSYLIAIPLGVISAVKQYSKFDYAVTSVAFVGQAAPSYWVAMLLIYGLAMHSNHLIPTNGISTAGMDLSNTGFVTVFLDRAKYALMPVIVMTFGSLTGLTRYMRGSMLEVLKEDYVRTARAKGVSERVVVYKHAMRNALLPIVTISGGILAALVSGATITETIFSWPGLGRVSYEAVVARDYPVVMATLLMGSVLLLIGFLLVDVAYVFVDPRIKYD